MKQRGANFFPAYQRTRSRVNEVLSQSDKSDAVGVAFDVVLYLAIGMVLGLTWLNTLQVVHSSESFRRFHHVAVIVVTGFFMAEYALRLWSCTAGGKSFTHPLSGRIRFALAPLQLIDALAIASVLILGVSANLLFLRAIRLFSVSEYMGGNGIYSPVQILKRSILNKKEELVITVFVSGTVIILCAYAIFYIEKDFQPESITSLTPSIAWAFGVLTGSTPQGFEPVTGIGQLLYVSMTIMGVVIVGLPVGIITGGFIQEIELAKASEEAQKKAALIRRSFGIEDKIPVRKLLKSLGIDAHRRVLDFDVAMARLQFSSEDIFDAVASDPGLRIRAGRQSKDSLHEDNLHIEEFTANTLFGGFIKRAGRMHVVCTQSCGDAGAGHYSRTLSNVLGASYYSNEFFSSGELLPDRQFNFATNPLYHESCGGDVSSAYVEWKHTLEENITPGDYVFYVGTASASRLAALHVLFGGVKGVAPEAVAAPTLDFPEHVLNFYRAVSVRFNEMDLSVGTHEDFANVNPNHVSLFMRQVLRANVVSLIVSVELLQFRPADLYYRSIKCLADEVLAAFPSPVSS